MPNFWDKYDKDINELAGNISNITRFDNYQEAYDDLQKYKDEEDQFNRVGELRRKLKSVDRSQIPQYRDEDTPQLNSDYFEMLPPDKLPPELDDYEKYAKFIEEQKDPNKQVKSFDDYLSTLGIKDAFMQTYPGAYKVGKKQVPLTEEEQEEAMFKQAGLSPEDAAFFKEYENKSVKPHNKALDQFMLQYGPQLRSMGSMGNTYEDELKKQVEGLKLDETAPVKYDVSVDEKSGNIVYTNPLDPNDRQIVKYANVEKPPTTKEWDIFEDENGKPYYGERVFKNGKWSVEYRDELNKKEVDDYSVYKQKRDKEGIYAPKVGSTGRRHSSGRQDKITDSEARDIIAYESADENQKAEYRRIAELTNNKQMLAEFDKIDNGGSTNNSGNNDYSVDLDGADEYEKQLYDGANEDQKAALQGVEKWFAGTIKAWGRADLTPDEWRNEIGQEAWNDLEFEIVKELFRKKFGEDY